MKDKFVIDVEKALDEKRQMAKIYERENGCRSTVLDLVIEHFESMLEEKET